MSISRGATVLLIAAGLLLIPATGHADLKQKLTEQFRKARANLMTALSVISKDARTAVNADVGSVREMYGSAKAFNSQFDAWWVRVQRLQTTKRAARNAGRMAGIMGDELSKAQTRIQDRLKRDRKKSSKKGNSRRRWKLRSKSKSKSKARW